MLPKVSYPPSHTATKAKTITPIEAQKLLSSFLEKTATKAYLHPDAQLSTTGITYAAASGPTGGLAIHHLKRIEAGLRGELLVAESEEELKMLFADTVEPEGDDTKVDGLIAASKKRKRTDEVAQWAEASSGAAFAQDGGDAAAGDWQDPEEYAQQQEEITGELDARGAQGVRQDRDAPPEIEDGQVDKVARAAAKKARKKAEKAEKLAAKKS
ncbi:Hypothetical protein R9X50_00656600 [Acrodontium crateriforme]|uniref:Uncharacterized protein n=1 Tax=Acrodontium crateriforme TaxID=150365 RepID=A0AAQ3MB73_9PEZI|nr:Hypothetical protein R9X50_00656600 [Acrodontium crateriforme]